MVFNLYKFKFQGSMYCTQLPLLFSVG